MQLAKATSTLPAPRTRNKITARFKGEVGLSARRAQKTLETLKDAGGKWTQYSVQSPTGGTVPIYLAEDKNARQVAEERALKRLAQALRTVHEDKTFFTIRRDRTITFNWTPIAKVRVPKKHQEEVEWNAAAAEKEDIKKFEVLQIFREKRRSPNASVNDIPWCQ